MPAQAQQLWLLLAPAAPLQWLGRTRPGVSVPRRAPGVITRQRLGLLPRDCLSSTLPAAPAEAMLSASRADRHCYLERRLRLARASAAQNGAERIIPEVAGTHRSSRRTIRLRAPLRCGASRTGGEGAEISPGELNLGGHGPGAEIGQAGRRSSRQLGRGASK